MYSAWNNDFDCSNFHLYTHAHTHTHTIDLHRKLGRANEGVVYTLFSRQAQDSDELGFTDGEQLKIIDRGGKGDQWWLAENTQGKQGVVPCTFLGPHQPPTSGTLL